MLQKLLFFEDEDELEDEDDLNPQSGIE